MQTDFFTEKKISTGLCFGQVRIGDVRAEHIHQYNWAYVFIQLGSFRLLKKQMKTENFEQCVC